MELYSSSGWLVRVSLPRRLPFVSAVPSRAAAVVPSAPDTSCIGMDTAPSRGRRGHHPSEKQRQLGELGFTISCVDELSLKNFSQRQNKPAARPQSKTRSLVTLIHQRYKSGEELPVAQ